MRIINEFLASAMIIITQGLIPNHGQIAANLKKPHVKSICEY
jgi:hypothetical protein